MEEETKPSDEGEVCPVSPTYRAGDTIVFKYEGNVRATVEGCELVDDRPWLRCRAEPLERNIPRPAKTSKLVEKSMDSISQITWVNCLIACLTSGLLNVRSEELLDALDRLYVLLGEFLSRRREQGASEQEPHPVYTRLYPPESQTAKAA